MVPESGGGEDFRKTERSAAGTVGDPWNIATATLGTKWTVGSKVTFNGVAAKGEKTLPPTQDASYYDKFFEYEDLNSDFLVVLSARQGDDLIIFRQLIVKKPWSYELLSSVNDKTIEAAFRMFADTTNEDKLQQENVELKESLDAAETQLQTLCDDFTSLQTEYTSLRKRIVCSFFIVPQFDSSLPLLGIIILVVLSAALAVALGARV